MKKIFYLIPLYNSANTISECLFSICSLKHIVEVVVINDNSQDDSSITINKIKDKLPYKIHVINNKFNIGISDSLNKGLEIALSNNADYIIRLDSDDFNTKGRTDFQIEYMESNPKKMICTSNANLLSGNSIKNGFLLQLKSLFENQFRPFSNLVGSIDLHPTFCMRIEPFRNFGIRYGSLPSKLNPNNSEFFMREGMEDLLLINLFIYYYGFNCIHRDVSRKLITYRINPKSLTPRSVNIRQKFLKKILLANQIIFNIKPREEMNLICLWKLSSAISRHYYKNKITRIFTTFIGFLIIKLNYSNKIYKKLIFPILFFIIPRLSIQSIKRI